MNPQSTKDSGSTRRSDAAGSRRRQRGAVTVEAAFAVPIVVMLTVGGLDMGRAYFHQHVVLEAAQSGVRVAALPGSSVQDVKDAAEEVLDGAGISDYTITYSNVGTTALRGSTSSCTVSSNFTTLSGSLIPGWSGSVTLTQTAKARHE